MDYAEIMSMPVTRRYRMIMKKNDIERRRNNAAK